MGSVPEQVSTKSDAVSDPLAMSALDGFLLVLSSDGDMVFLSENVQEYLGLNQVSHHQAHPLPHRDGSSALPFPSLPFPSRPFPSLALDLGAECRVSLICSFLCPVPVGFDGSQYLRVQSPL